MWVTFWNIEEIWNFIAWLILAIVARFGQFWYSNFRQFCWSLSVGLRWLSGQCRWPKIWEEKIISQRKKYWRNGGHVFYSADILWRPLNDVELCWSQPSFNFQECFWFNKVILSLIVVIDYGDGTLCIQIWNRKRNSLELKKDPVWVKSDLFSVLLKNNR